jgi:hypothetical protein
MSEERQNKAERSIGGMCKKELEKIEEALKKLYTKELLCPYDAKGALKCCFSKSKFYEVLEGGNSRAEKI